jgi:Tfp pilus assembly protein PilX
MKRNESLANEDGTILVISLIILALASMIGIAATMTASIELQVSGNDMRYAENFYRAEAAAMVGARAIEESTDKLPDGKYQNDGEDITLPNVDKKGVSADIPDADNIGDDSNWTTGTNKISAEAPDAISDASAGYEARFLPVEKPSTGASLDLAGTAGTKMHEFVIYGRSIRENPNSNKRLGEVIIEVGYKKRF